MNGDKIPLQFQELVIDVRARYKTELEDLSDSLAIFRDELWKHSKRWGTYKELIQVHLIERDGTKRPINMYDDPNITGEMLFGGLGGWGFLGSIVDRDNKPWNVKLHDGVFTFEEVVQ